MAIEGRSGPMGPWAFPQRQAVAGASMSIGGETGGETGSSRCLAWGGSMGVPWDFMDFLIGFNGI